jgi:hypothetical protein
MFFRKNRSPSRESRGFSTRCKFVGEATGKIAGRSARSKNVPPSWPELLAKTARQAGRLESSRHAQPCRNLELRGRYTECACYREARKS